MLFRSRSKRRAADSALYGTEIVERNRAARSAPERNWAADQIAKDFPEGTNYSPDHPKFKRLKTLQKEALAFDKRVDEEQKALEQKLLRDADPDIRAIRDSAEYWTTRSDNLEVVAQMELCAEKGHVEEYWKLAAGLAEEKIAKSEARAHKVQTAAYDATAASAVAGAAAASLRVQVARDTLAMQETKAVQEEKTAQAQAEAAR